MSNEQQDYDDSSEDEWTRPSVDVVAKNDSESSTVGAATGADPASSSSPSATADQPAGPSGNKQGKDYTWDADEKALAGNDVLVVFEISEGGQVTKLEPHRFVMGVTIAHLKTHLDDIHRVPYDSQKMFLGEQMLIDPLSLNDCQFRAGEVNVVRVEI